MNNRKIFFKQRITRLMRLRSPSVTSPKLLSALLRATSHKPKRWPKYYTARKRARSKKVKEKY